MVLRRLSHVVTPINGDDTAELSRPRSKLNARRKWYGIKFALNGLHAYQTPNLNMFSQDKGSLYAGIHQFALQNIVRDKTYSQTSRAHACSEAGQQQCHAHPAYARRTAHTSSSSPSIPFVDTPCSCSILARITDRSSIF